MDKRKQFDEDKRHFDQEHQRYMEELEASMRYGDKWLHSSSYLKQTKILCGQLNCSVKLADVSTRCSSHPQVRKAGALIPNS